MNICDVTLRYTVHPCTYLKRRSDMVLMLRQAETDLFQAVTKPTVVLHGINPSPPGVITVHVWTLLKGPISLAGTSRRRDCRDWSVAATRTTRETKKLLALSPKKRCRDCRDWSVAATRETKLWLALSRRGDVSETCWRLKKSPKKKSNMFEFPATPRRPGKSPGDVAETRVAT